MPVWSTGGKSGAPPIEQPPQQQSDGPIPEAPNSIKLFDTYRSTLSYQLDIGPLWTRRASETTVLSRREDFRHRTSDAGEISLGSYTTTTSQKGPFYIASEALTTFRILDSKSFSWAIFAQKLGGGIALGPIEIDGKVGVDGLVVDIMHAQPSIQLLSPGVEAGVGIHLGTIRLDIKAHSEYLWRWFGPDYFLRSVTIGFRFDRPRPKTTPVGGPTE